MFLIEVRLWLTTASICGFLFNCSPIMDCFPSGVPGGASRMALSSICHLCADACIALRPANIARSLSGRAGGWSCGLAEGMLTFASGVKQSIQPAASLVASFFGGLHLDERLRGPLAASPRA